jgi:STE24 endopeptidase
MHPFTILFLFALAAGLALRLWLLARQARTVRAHRDRVPSPFDASVSAAHHARAADYAVAQTKLAAAERSAGALLLAALTLAGGIASVESWSHATGLAGLPRQVAVIAVIVLIGALAGIPFDAWRTFRIEARFGFNRTTAALFALDLVKSLVIGGILLLPMAALVLWLMPRAGRAWWLWAWAAWALFSVALGWAWPRVIAPLFNRFRPLEDGNLRRAIEALARRCGFEARDVQIMDGSKRSSHGNAFFTGFGRTKRIVLFDTLLESLAPDEVQAVLAHELGHFRLRHTAIRIAGSLALTLAGFALLGWLAGEPWFQPALGVPEGGPHTLLVLFVLVAPVFLVPITPVFAWLSRRQEYAADRFAARHVEARTLASALVRLYRDNATTLTPDPLYTAFHASHPPALDRIARLLGAPAE